MNTCSHRSARPRVREFRKATTECMHIQNVLVFASRTPVHRIYIVEHLLHLLVGILFLARERLPRKYHIQHRTIDTFRAHLPDLQPFIIRIAKKQIDRPLSHTLTMTLARAVPDPPCCSRARTSIIALHPHGRSPSMSYTQLAGFASWKSE